MIGAPAQRLTALRRLLVGLDLDAAVISRAAHVHYFSGFQLARGEEATSGHSGTLFVTADEQLILADSRYVEQAQAEGPAWELFRTSRSLAEELSELLGGRDVLDCGMEAESLTHADWSQIAQLAPGSELHRIDEELAALRIIKDEREIELIGRACALGDRCFEYLLGVLRPGMSERELAWELESFLRANGSEGIAFEPIVLAGPRASMPHGRPSDARIESGNVLLLDFGCQIDGYRSDMTRTVFVGEPDDELRDLYAVVQAAQQAAIDLLHPGVTGVAVDAAARDVIARAGHGNAFGHGVGHGIGLETHEAPMLRRYAEPLQVGMVFSVEPGIYLPGRTGIRIEDIVALDESGPRLLTGSSRELLVIG
ncbi:MAG: Xaa-Pro peptidase family protein [Chloroflexota bacterium]|nr:Xaa-Pro peptidase family protein [Chloroflexota bacterium]